MIPTVRTELRAPGRWDPQRSRIRDSPLPAGRSASPRHLSLRTCPVHSGRLRTLPVQSLWPYAFYRRCTHQAPISLRVPALERICHLPTQRRMCEQGINKPPRDWRVQTMHVWRPRLASEGGQTPCPTPTAPLVFATTRIGQPGWCGAEGATDAPEQRSSNGGGNPDVECTIDNWRVIADVSGSQIVGSDAQVWSQVVDPRSVAGGRPPGKGQPVPGSAGPQLSSDGL